MTLYELTGDMLALKEMLEDPGTDVQLIMDTIEAVEGQIEAKVDGYGAVIRELEAEAKALKEEAARMKERQAVIENRNKYLKLAIFNVLKAMGKTKVDGTIFHFSIQKNGGTLPVMLDVPEDQIPEVFQKITRTVDTKAVAEYLKAESEEGRLVEWAHFGERGESLRLK